MQLIRQQYKCLINVVIEHRAVPFGKENRDIEAVSPSARAKAAQKMSSHSERYIERDIFAFANPVLP